MKIETNVLDKKVDEITKATILFRLQEKKLNDLLDNNNMMELKKIIYQNSYRTNEKLIDKYMKLLKSLNTEDYFQKTKEFDLTKKDSNIPKNYKNIFYNIDDVLEEFASATDEDEKDTFLNSEIIVHQLIVNEFNLYNEKKNKLNIGECIESFCIKNNIRLLDSSLILWIIIILSVHYHVLRYAKDNPNVYN